MIRACAVLCSALLVAGVAPLRAQPALALDPSLLHHGGGYRFTVGEVDEREQEFVRHAFVIRNTGDRALRILEVRAGCHCTVVDFDSVIAPGDSGVLRQEVNLHGFRSGPFYRGVDITHNISGTPVLKLGIQGVIRSPVEIAESKVSLYAANTLLMGPVVTVRTPKEYAKVTGVVFRRHVDRARPWRPQFPLTLDYLLIDEIPSADGKSVVLKLRIGAEGRLVRERSIPGVLFIQTTHPEKPEVGVSAVLM